MDISSAPMYANFEFRDSAIPPLPSTEDEAKRSLRWPAYPDYTSAHPKHKAAWLGLRIVLKNYHGMFMCRNTVTDTLLDQCGAVVKQEIKRTRADVPHREYLANSGDLWTLMTDVFEIGTRVLRLQSFPDAPTYDEHGCSFSNFMASNHPTLIKDIERLNDLLSLSRNMLASTKITQEAAASAKFDQQVLQVIDACIRVTARGYDGEPANPTESKWANIIAAYKKLTMTALQWLHNFVAHNEQRKIHLFNQLFGDFQVPDPDYSYDSSDLDLIAEKVSSNNGLASEKDFDPYLFQESPALKVMDEIIRSVRGYCGQTSRHIPEYPSDFPESQYGSFLVSVMNSLKDKHQNGLCGENVPSFAALPSAYFRRARSEAVSSEAFPVTSPDEAAENIMEAKDKVLSEFLYQMTETDRISGWDASKSPVIGQAMAAPAAGLAQSEALPSVPATQQPSRTGILDLEDEDPEDDEFEPGEDDDEEDEEEDEEDDEDDSEDEIGSASRGLLTDIPLVLGPNEIEALPLMIQSAIRSTADPKDTTEEIHVMQALRCYRMISESAGRNLLRELLIFIAAWDLQEHEHYFRLMMSIMETILSYGLMPYAFNSFSEDKDVVSPAQSILIKLLTNMFRKRQTDSLSDAKASRPSSQFPSPPAVEETIVRYIFEVFRTHIIPQTCALIYLQGQIRLGKVLPEDFPLNLWDMERVYEGVYQFLEFFAVLTETEAWKTLLVKEEIVFELITLLRELDISIPKSTEIQAPVPPPSAETPTPPVEVSRRNQNAAKSAAQEFEDEINSPDPIPAAAPVSVERPYDPSPSPVGELGAFPTGAAPDAPSDAGSAMLENNIEPADFEWRNLKKLVVLVLSSLVWRSPTVQDQIRAHGGVEMILNCCNADGNNPYIKDHAVMCLRFLLEGSKENQKIVRDIEERRSAERLGRDQQGRGGGPSAKGRRQGGAAVAAAVENLQITDKS